MKPTISTSIASRRGTLVMTIEIPIIEALAADEKLGFLVQDHVETQLIYDIRQYMDMLKLQKEDGKVKWFDDKKGYGFLLTSYGDLFVHWRGIAGSGYKSLLAGQSVRFFRRPGVTGDEAVEVEVTDTP